MFSAATNSEGYGSVLGSQAKYGWDASVKLTFSPKPPVTARCHGEDDHVRVDGKAAGPAGAVNELGNDQMFDGSIAPDEPKCASA